MRSCRARIRSPDADDLSERLATLELDRCGEEAGANARQPPYGQANYTNENFPGSFQTQVTGLNNTGQTVGFWADTAGDNFGWVKSGVNFIQVVDPLTRWEPPASRL